MTQSTKPKFLLACGVALGSLFYVVVVAQILTRAGFDIRRQLTAGGASLKILAFAPLPGM